MDNLAPEALLQKAAVVLVRPQIPENVGAAARALKNMGLGRLVVVRPKVWSLERMLTLAVRTGREAILSEVALFTDLGEALEPYEWVVGATARWGRFRRPAGPPRSVLSEAAGLLPRNNVALVFGPEDNGLTTDELKLCHRLVYIPAAPKASSLNLAQAVMILAYELRQAALLDGQTVAEPRLAPAADIQGMYGHINEALDAIDPEEHYARHVWLEALRRLFNRARLQPHEVRLIRGVCRKIVWTMERRRVE